MEFEQMLPTLQSQASRIFQGDKDSMQDALAMAYENYNSYLSRNNSQLSIGELTNFIKYRATELNNGTRPHFGNTSNKRTNDVYFRLAYLDGQVERLYFDYEDPDNEETDRGQIAFQTRVPHHEDDILFNIDFTKFRKRLNSIERELLNWLVIGYNPKEISGVLQLDYNHVRTRLNQIGIKFTDFFKCRDAVVA